MIDKNMAQKSYNSPKLDEVRQRIDTLDNSIHQMLMERAELVLQIGAEKRKNNIQIVQPAREARMIRRLLSRHKGVLPEMAVVRIWRELVGAVSLLQTGLKVSVSCNDDDQQGLWDLARDYFGSCLPFQKAGSPLSAIAAVREGRATFAVVPWPEDVSDNPWWSILDNESGSVNLHINIRLPHGDDPAHENPDQKGLVISQTGFDESDDDMSFLIVSCPDAISRAKLVDVFAKEDVKIKTVSSKRSQDQSDPLSGAQHFVEVHGYIMDGNPVLEKLSDHLGEGARVLPLGGYPVPPIYSKTIEARKD